MDTVVFEVLESYGSPTVYFCEYDIEQSCLVVIPSWNWSFLMDYAADFKDEKTLLMEASESHVSCNHVENVTMLSIILCLVNYSNNN